MGCYSVSTGSTAWGREVAMCGQGSTSGSAQRTGGPTAPHLLVVRRRQALVQVLGPLRQVGHLRHAAAGAAGLRARWGPGGGASAAGRASAAVAARGALHPRMQQGALKRSWGANLAASRVHAQSLRRAGAPLTPGALGSRWGRVLACGWCSALICMRMGQPNGGLRPNVLSPHEQPLHHGHPLWPAQTLNLASGY